MKRKHFLKLSALAIPGFAVSGQAISSQIDPAIVKEFVAVSHNDIIKVEKMLLKTPQLVACTYDWGDGDFEQGIEGAGHVGDLEIVDFQIRKGARINIFIMALLGKTDSLKVMIEDFPDILTSPGPHGFTLLQYANMGGDLAISTKDFLLEKGLNKTKVDM